MRETAVAEVHSVHSRSLRIVKRPLVPHPLGEGMGDPCIIMGRGGGGGGCVPTYTLHHGGTGTIRVQKID